MWQLWVWVPLLMVGTAAGAITDPLTGGPGSRNALVFDVDRMDGRPVGAKYSTMSEKHAAQFEPYLPDKRYRSYDFTIIRTGEGFRTSYSLTAIPIT